MRLETGLTGQLFDAPLILQDLVTDTWMKQTWIATREANIHLMINIPDFPLSRQGDIELVRIFLQHGLRQPQLGAIHRCRMFLKVLRLSDICNGTGDKIITRNWQNYRPSESEFNWPITIKPSAADWNTWNATITNTFQVDRYLNLQQKLGTFYPHKHTGWFYDPNEQAIWSNQNNQWQRHSRIPARSRTLTFHKQGEVREKPQARLHRATVQAQAQKLILTGSAPIAPIPCTESALTRLLKHSFAQIWQWETLVVGNLQQLINDLQSGKGYAVSDGSFQAGKGAAAWIIEGKDNTNRIIGRGLSPSDDEGHSSFRSKLAGIFAIMFTLQILLPATPTQSTRPSLRLACDGKSVLSRLKRIRMTDPQEPHADLISATRTLIKISAVQVELIHVKGHQDNKILGPFTRDATLNIEADQLA